MGQEWVELEYWTGSKIQRLTHQSRARQQLSLVALESGEGFSVKRKFYFPVGK